MSASSPSPWPNIIGAIIGAVGGGGISFAVAKYQAARNTKSLEYDVFRMPVRTPGSALIISADKALITGKSEDTGVLAPVDDAYGYAVDVTNVGSVAVENPTVELQLPVGARMLEHSTSPRSSQAFPIQVNRDSDSPEVIRVTFPYINSKESVSISVVSTGSKKSDVRVIIMGLGIKVRKHDPKRELKRALVVPLVGLAYCLNVLLFLTLPNKWLAQQNQLGFRARTVVLAEWPIWLDALVGISMLLFFVWSVRAVYLRIGRRVKKPRD